MEVRVVPSQDKARDYKPVKPNHLKRHVSNLVLIVPAEDQANFEQEKSKDDAEDVHGEQSIDDKEDDAEVVHENRSNFDV